MKASTKILLSFVCSLLFLGIIGPVFSQNIMGLGFGYEVFPSVELVDPIDEAPGLEIGAKAWNLGASFPMMLKEGKIIIANQIHYKRTDFTYGNFPEDGNNIDQIQSIDYTFFMIDSLSQKWKMLAIITPGLASDFEGKVSGDDFTFAGVFGFIRTTSPKFQYGFGIAYMPDFGEPIPLPFLYLDWKIKPRLSLSGIVPSNLNLTYKMSRKMDIGLALKVDGNMYHGNPDKFDVDRPLLKYSEGTLSPSLIIHFSKMLHLSIEGGYAFFRNFEFYDDDDKIQSYDLKQTGYIRTGFVFGI